jgi:hypothetical protein
MAKYTVELREIVKSGLNIFDFEYEFYDVTKKADFEKKFINHFYFKEIGSETVGRFMHFLKCKCDETLPFYNMLFRTALIDYEKTINYNLTDTFTRGVNKTDTLTGNASSEGSKVDNSKVDGSSHSTLNNTETGNKTNTLNSTTDRTEETDVVRSGETLEDINGVVTGTNEINNKKVSSDTPQALLTIGDIKSQIYASSAEIDDNTSKTIDDNKTKTNRTEDITEGTDHSLSDTVNATNTDVTNITNAGENAETNTSTLKNDGTFESKTDTTQNATSNENETATRVMRGSYGVITEADMLQKHIELQRILTTILTKFFNECEDLFMQIY